MTSSSSTKPIVALNADVVGYSRLMADDPVSTSSAIEKYRNIVSEAVKAADGTLVNFVGDNFMAVFSDAGSALRAGISISTTLEQANDRVANPLRFRMGLDQGVATVSEDRYFGDVLNIAARIQSLAPPGGISVSERVYMALDEPALRFRPIGRHTLKNIPGSVGVYEFLDLPTDPASRDRPTSLSLESPTLAVLPIHTELVDRSAKSMAEVVRSDLIHRLASIPQLDLIDASMSPASGSLPGSARYAIESGIHQHGSEVRIYMTAFDLTTMNVVKAHKWTGELSKLLSVSEELANDMAISIEVELIVGAPAALYSELADPEAIEAVYLGWYQLTAGTAEGWAKAIELFDSVARSHPEHTYGTVLAAFANWTGVVNGWASNPKATLELAHQQAKLGNSLGDPTGMAKTVEAAVLMSQGKGEEAIAAMEEVEIVRPTCDVTFGLEGSVRRYMGQWEKAIDLTDTAMRLTGVNKPWYPTVKACSLLMGGRSEQAATVAEMVLDYQPHNLEALLVLAAAQVEMGLQRRAEATAGLIKERFPSVDVAAWLDRNPYQDRTMVDRWKQNLVRAGVLAPT